jgi:hypothetical protein
MAGRARWNLMHRHAEIDGFARLDGLSRHAIRLDVTVLVYAIARIVYAL